MPNINFQMPHIIYWGLLLFFPFLAAFFFKKEEKVSSETIRSLPIAYFMLIMVGYLGLHRIYLKKMSGFLLIPLFLFLLSTNVDVRTSRNEVSRANNDLIAAEYEIEYIESRLADGLAEQSELDEAIEILEKAKVEKASVEEDDVFINRQAALIGLVLLFVLILDAFLLPGMLRKFHEKYPSSAPAAPVLLGEEPTISYKTEVASDPLSGFINAVNEKVGTFVAYWSIIAVFIYFIEVILRYVFNSPTNWAHESMFLMFGMQYFLAGAYVLKYDGHVRVDVFYTNFSLKKKALVDILTSVFFFIYAVTLVLSGWTFFMDSYSVSEVSLSDWAIQYYPVKLAIPLGSLLILFQGIVCLIRDFKVYFSQTQEQQAS